MSIYDRDWYREEYKRKEQEYGGDFSLHSKKVIPLRKKSTRVNILTTLLCPILSLLSFLIAGTLGGNPIPPIAAMLLAIYFFIRTLKRRNFYNSGFTNKLAMISSIVSASFSTVLSIFLIYYSVTEEKNPFVLPNNWVQNMQSIKVPNPIEETDIVFSWHQMGESTMSRTAILPLLLILMGALLLFTFFLSSFRRIRVKKRIKGLTESAIEMTPEEFLQLKGQRIGRRQISLDYDFPGVYILLNKTRNMYYVGQGKMVLSRVKQHFTGHGNGDVYADWKYGNQFTIRIIKLEGSGFATLNTLERKTITAYNAFSKGYNKTRGNRG